MTNFLVHIFDAWLQTICNAVVPDIPLHRYKLGGGWEYWGVGAHAHEMAFLFFSGEYFGFFQQFQAESLTISSPFFIYLH